MEPTARLYQCALCHKQVKICSKCDRGNIYCDPICAARARMKSLKFAGFRYQTTLNGKRRHAARQARYRMRLRKIVTHRGSPPTPQHASIRSIENKTINSEVVHNNAPLTCCFCENPISDWLRKDFLRRRDYKKSSRLKACAQSP
jgi:hypothetical protein